MNTKLIVVLSVVVLGLAAVALFFTGPTAAPASAESSPQPTNTQTAAPAVPSSNFDFGPSGSFASAGQASASSTPPKEPFEVTPDANGLVPLVDNEEDLKRSKINDEILEAVVTYAPEGVPVIQPFLTNKDPLVRESAINGMIQIGVPEAAKALRDASKRPGLSNKERLQMLEAADFIELPPFEFPARPAAPAQTAAPATPLAPPAPPDGSVPVAP